MPITHSVGNDLSSGSLLREPGWYHLVVDAATDTPTKAGGVPIAEAMFQVTCKVCAGTAPGTRDKSINITIFHPKPDKDFSKKKVDRMLAALGVVKPGDEGKEFSFEADDLLGRQFIANLEPSQDGKYLQVAWADTFHVDDPEVANHPKDAVMLSLIPASLRRIGTTTSAPANKANPPMPKPPAVAAAAARNDLNSI
jgi:hypothetical protein